MRNKISCTLCFALFLVCSLNAQNQKKDFRWLTGTWKVNIGSGFIIESWQQVNDSLYKGKSLLVKGKDSTVQETLEIVKRDTSWYYASTVNGQNNNKAVSFKIIFQRFGEFIGENPAHDFPQRIAYRRFLPTQMHASIEGNSKGRYSKQNFNFYLEDKSELFCYTITLLPKFADNKIDTTISSVFKKHIKFLDSLGIRGSVIFSGQTAFETYDLKMTEFAVIKAIDLEKAKGLIAADPAVLSGIFKGELFPFRMNSWYPGSFGK